MYIEYKIICGVLHMRYDPQAEFVPMDANAITTYVQYLESELAALKEQNAGCSRVLTNLMTEHRKLVEAIANMLEKVVCYPEHARILYKLLPEPPEVENA